MSRLLKKAEELEGRSEKLRHRAHEIKAGIVSCSTKKCRYLLEPDTVISMVKCDDCQHFFCNHCCVLREYQIGHCISNVGSLGGPVGGGLGGAIAAIFVLAFLIGLIELLYGAFWCIMSFICKSPVKQYRCPSCESQVNKDFLSRVVFVSLAVSGILVLAFVCFW